MKPIQYDPSDRDYHQKRTEQENNLNPDFIQYRYKHLKDPDDKLTVQKQSDREIGNIISEILFLQVFFLRVRA